jgi:hypothetical protein
MVSLDAFAASDAGGCVVTVLVKDPITAGTPYISIGFWHGQPDPKFGREGCRLHATETTWDS